MDFIVTYFPDLRKYTFNELENLGFSLTRHLSPGISYVNRPKSPPGIDASIFIRHIFPVGNAGVLPSNREETLTLLLENAKALSLPTFSNKTQFSVQCRIVGGKGEFSAKDVEVFIGSYFDKMGHTPIFSDFALSQKQNLTDINVISLLLNEDEFFMGISSAAQNGAFNPDEYRVMSRNKDGGRTISRAENKLKEAINKWNLEITGNGYALDVGAAPGGWSKVLADYGFTVFAADPANLHESLKTNTKIHHFKQKIQDLIFDANFNIIVCDMNIEPADTAAIMNVLSKNIVSGTTAVVTLKLPFADVWRSIDESRRILEENYDILSIKNLTHNRREVTALLRRK